MNRSASNHRNTSEDVKELFCFNNRTLNQKTCCGDSGGPYQYETARLSIQNILLTNE